MTRVETSLGAVDDRKCFLESHTDRASTLQLSIVRIGDWKRGRDTSFKNEKRNSRASRRGTGSSSGSRTKGATSRRSRRTSARRTCIGASRPSPLPPFPGRVLERAGAPGGALRRSYDREDCAVPLRFVLDSYLGLEFSRLSDSDDRYFKRTRAVRTALHRTFSTVTSLRSSRPLCQNSQRNSKSIPRWRKDPHFRSDKPLFSNFSPEQATTSPGVRDDRRCVYSPETYPAHRRDTLQPGRGVSNAVRLAG